MFSTLCSQTRLDTQIFLHKTIKPFTTHKTLKFVRKWFGFYLKSVYKQFGNFKYCQNHLVNNTNKALQKSAFLTNELS